jgi:hypothetical protein
MMDINRSLILLVVLVLVVLLLLYLKKNAKDKKSLSQGLNASEMPPVENKNKEPE